MRREDWGEKGIRDADLSPICARIQDLAEAQLKGEHVVAHIVEHCVAPLQRRSRLMWQYTGINDATPLFTGRRSVLDLRSLKKVVMELMGGLGEIEPLPAGIIPLYDDPHLDAPIVGLPDCDEWGISESWVPPGTIPRLSLMVVGPALSTRTSSGRAAVAAEAENSSQG